MKPVYQKTPSAPQPPPIRQDEMERVRRILEESEERVRELFDELDKSDPSRASSDRRRKRRLG